MKTRPPAADFGIKFSWTTFTPAEAAGITELSPAMQRDWRHREFLPAVSGHARFNAIDLAAMWTLKMLSDRGIGPQRGKTAARAAGEGIVLAALQEAGSWAPWPRALQVPNPWIDMDFAKTHFREFEPQRFLVWWPDGSHEWTDNLNDTFRSVGSGDAESRGPVVVLDTLNLGKCFFDRAGRALVQVTRTARANARKAQS